MSSRRVKSPGWAAFDLKQRQKQGLEPQIDKDPYPPISSTFTSPCNCENITRTKDLLMRPFSSVLLPSVDFPTLTENNVQKHARNCDSDPREKHGNKVIEENNQDLALKKLKVLNSWADDSLIADIMAVVDNNIEKASNLLSGMVSGICSNTDNKKTKIDESSSTVDDSQCRMTTVENFLVKQTLDLSNLSSSSGDSIKDTQMTLTGVHDSSRQNIPDNAVDMKSMLEWLSSLPIEPEWEEDDIYMVHRKDALKMMRSASQHSKAANNAFLRGDHFSAQQHSLKGQKEWLIAERLNSKAAKEILNIRNMENGTWKLDLHGLHAAEAVHAVQERLQKIEMQIPIDHLAPPNSYKAKKGTLRNSSFEPCNFMDAEDMDKQQPSLRQIQKPLQVITGVGNRSQGQASLPAAVKNFLSENSYHFDETRPGVITVRPKFRHR